MKSLNRYYYGGQTETFSPHCFKSEIEMISGIPKVLMSKAVYNKMWHYVDLASKEVSWLGTVIKHNSNFLIQDVFLLRQEVTGAQTVITEDGLAEFGEGILKLPNGVDIYNNIRFWGHSHVYMGTGPSGQDDDQMDIFEKSDHPFFIRGILNKKGRIEFTIYFYDTGLKIVDPEWRVYDPIDGSIRATIEKEFYSKVSEPRTVISSIYDKYVNPSIVVDNNLHSNYNDHKDHHNNKHKHKHVNVRGFRKNGPNKTTGSF